MNERHLTDPAKNNGPRSAKNGEQRSLVTRNAALMEYTPRDLSLDEYQALLLDEPTFRDSLKILFRQKSVILVSLLVTLLAVYAGSQLHTPFYETRVKFLIRAEKMVESPYYRDLGGSFKSEIVLTQAELVKSNPVLERVVRALKLDERPLNYERPFASPIKQFVMDLKAQRSQKTIEALESNKALRFRFALKNLGRQVKVKPIPNTTLFMISVRDFDPIAATRIANAISHYYVVFDLEQQLAELGTKYGEKNATIRQLRDDTEKFEKRIGDRSGTYADVMGPASAKIMEEASVPMERTGFPLSLVLLLGGVCGMILGVALAFLFERIDPTFRSADDVRKTLNLDIIGSVPVRKFGPKLLTKKPFFSTGYTRSFQDLADQVSVLMDQKACRSLLVAACSPGEGASLVTANLAHHLSKTGHKILVIDANFRHPVLHKLFHLANGEGLSDVLQGKSPLENAVRFVHNDLDVLPTKKHETNPLALLNSPRMGELMQKLGGSYDMVLVDSSNLKNFKDSEILSGAMDGVMLVLEPGRARRQAVKTSLETLERKKVNVLGVVLNKRVFHVPQILYRQA